MIHTICPARQLAALKLSCLHGLQAATLKGSSQKALVDARLFRCRKYHCAGGAELRCSWQEPRNLHWADEQLKSNARGSFLHPPRRGGQYPRAARCSFQREHQMLEGAATRQSCARLPRTLGRPRLQAAPASGEATLTKPRQPLLLPGRRGKRVPGWPRRALTLPRKPPGSGRWLGLAAGTATLPSSLRPGEQTSRERGQRPGAIPPARSRGGPAGGRGCCTADGSSCWHPWRWRRGAAAEDPSRSPGSERRGSVRASVAGARLRVCASVAGARGSARGARV